MRRRRGTPAGQVLVVVVAALVLGALVNADAMVRRASNKPFGPARDRSLAIWHPVQDVSHVVQLYRIRQFGDWLTGNQPQPVAAPITTTTTAPPGPESTTTTLPPRPVLRVPTVDDPLRVYIGGDSVIRDASESLVQLAAGDPLLRTAPPHFVISSGLTRQDFFNWPAALQTDMAATDPEVAIVMFGANDSQGIVAADGTICQPSDPCFAVEYAARVGAVMDLLRGENRLVFWIGQPPMRDPDFDARIRRLDDIYETQARTRPWVQYVDTAPLFGNGSGGYGDPELRQGDGIHLSREGADLLAQHLLDLVDAELPAPTTTTSTTSATTSTTSG